MTGVPGNDPGQSTAQQGSSQGDDCELGSTSTTKDGSQDEQGNCVGNQVLQWSVQERRPEDSWKASKVPWDDAVLVEMSAPQQIVEDEDQPAQGHKRKNGGESFDHL